MRRNPETDQMQREDKVIRGEANRGEEHIKCRGERKWPEEAFEKILKIILAFYSIVKKQ